MTDFVGFPKISRLSRECIITEKIDGTNASILITDSGEFFTGSRTRWITPADDNHGFSRWAHEHKDELLTLGPGHHFGEWWGASIQRGYGLEEKRFSLFNTTRWSHPDLYPKCCYVVPIVYQGLFDTHDAVNWALEQLIYRGSYAARGFLDPEGVVVYHVAANKLFKKTIKGDEEGKHTEAHPKRERKPQQPRAKDPSKGGRRKEQLPFEGLDRRMVQ